jgi:hypothetical protein
MASKTALTVARAAGRLRANPETDRSRHRPGKLEAGRLLGARGPVVPASEVARMLAGETSPLAASAGDPEA